MNKLIALSLIISISFLSIACSSKESEGIDSESASTTSEIIENVSVVSESTIGENEENSSSNEEMTLSESGDTSAASESTAAEDAVQTVEVDQNLLTVEITIPSDYVGETTQEKIDEGVKENGFISGELNSDGSVTYKMTKSQHKELLSKIKETIDSQLSDMIGSEDYPNFVNIETDDDYRNFTITTKSTELGLSESMSTLIFYMCGGMYASFSGEAVDNIHVDFVNEETGEVIQSADSKNLGN